MKDKMMTRIVMTMVGLAAMAVQVQTFSSAAFRVDTRQNTGVRTAADIKMIYALSLEQDDHSTADCEATIKAEGFENPNEWRKNGKFHQNLDWE